MKKVIYVLALAVFFTGCAKEDESEMIPQSNSLAEDLKQVIEAENIDLILPCDIGSICSGGTNDFSFPGDNIIRVGDDRYFNLIQLVEMEVEMINDNKRLVLYFLNE
ncbi:hypothetical protein [Halocola ammonii]